MENVILIRLPSYTSYVSPPLGIGYLIKAIETINGIIPIFIDCKRDNINERALLKKIKNINPLIIGFQVYSVDYPKFCRILPEIRKIHPATKIIAGGPHISALSCEALIDNPELDYVIKGEGEEALENLVNFLLRGGGSLSGNIDIGDIPNLVYRHNGRIIANESTFVDVNKYGAPAWERLQPDKYSSAQHGQFHKGSRVAPILTSRGCPYLCTFCAGRLTTGKEIRTRNINNIVDEIEFLQSRYYIEEFTIEDDNFTFYREHVLNLSKELKKRKIECLFSFPNGIRLDRIDDEIAGHLKKMGTYMVSLGIESASKKTLEAMKRNLDLQMVRDKIDLLHKHRIIVHGSFIVGFSNETMEDIKETIDFAISSGIDTAYFGNYIPLPGTSNFNRLIQEGELKSDKIDWSIYTLLYFGRIPYHPRGILEKDLIKVIRWGTIKFYCRPKVVFNFLRRMSHLVFLKILIFRIISFFMNGK